MKASELCELLNFLIMRHGDLQIVTSSAIWSDFAKSITFENAFMNDDEDTPVKVFLISQNSSQKMMNVVIMGAKGFDQ